jgi:hypothetical protein
MVLLEVVVSSLLLSVIVIGTLTAFDSATRFLRSRGRRSALAHRSSPKA